MPGEQAENLLEREARSAKGTRRYVADPCGLKQFPTAVSEGGSEKLAVIPEAARQHFMSAV